MDILTEIQRYEPSFKLEDLLSKLQRREEQRHPYIGTKPYLLYCELKQCRGSLSISRDGSFVTNIASLPVILDKVGLRYVLSSTDIQGELLMFDSFKGSIYDVDSQFIQDYNQIVHLWSGIHVPMKLSLVDDLISFSQ